jgi:FAD-linked oxidoreductase
MPKFSNWANTVSFTPEQIHFPTSEVEISAIVKNAGASGKKIRVVGSAHSWTGIFETNQILISLDKLQGLVKVDGMDATVWGGTKLKKLGDELFQHGLAMENLGDIDVQAIAGACSTGTHGTGVNFKSISNQVSKLRLITANGEILECSETENSEIFDAARVSLGTLGIITQITLRCISTYKLKFTQARENFYECLANLDKNNAENRNFEFYFFPHTDRVQTKYINETQEQPQKNGIGKFMNDVVLENGMFYLACKFAQFFPSKSMGVSKLLTDFIGPVTKINYSNKIYATVRLVHFYEMEYNIPAEHFKEAITKVKDVIANEKIEVMFPIECRFVKGDKLHLSPAYQRDSAYLAFHTYRGMPYKDYFGRMESIMLEYGGRPHWGKMHTQKADSLKLKYPKWDDFQKIREQLDPNQMFISPYLKGLILDA